MSGYIVKPGIESDLNKEIFYVPQKPYMAVGTLRDQLVYPVTENDETEPLTHSGMVELLKNVSLCYSHNFIHYMSTLEQLFTPSTRERERKLL